MGLHYKGKLPYLANRHWTWVKVTYSDKLFMVVIYSSKYVNLSHLRPSLDRRLPLWDCKGKLPYLVNKHWTTVKVMYSDKIFMVVIYSSRFVNLSHLHPSLDRHLHLWDSTIRVSSHILLTNIGLGWKYNDELFMVVIYSNRFASPSHFRPSLELHVPLWDCTLRVSSHILLC